MGASPENFKTLELYYMPYTKTVDSVLEDAIVSQSNCKCQREPEPEPEPEPKPERDQPSR